MEKTGDLFKKIRDTNGNISCKEKQKILRRGGKNTQKNCTKKILVTQISHDGVITHLEPDILECKLK